MSNFCKFKEVQKHPQLPGISEISPHELLQNSPSIYMVDVRQPEEYTGELGHVKDAVLIPLGELPSKIKTLPSNKTIVFICRSGGRSAQACAFAKQQGFNEIYNMKGGMLEWNNLSLPTEK